MYKVTHHSWHDYPFMRGKSYKTYNFKSRGLALLFARLLCFIINIDDLVVVVVVEDISNNSEKIIGIKSCQKKFRVLEVMSCQ